jgi:hypothetical protein
LVLVIDVGAATDARSASALTHALEEIAQHSRTAVVVLFQELPPFDSAFDRILYGARRVIADDGLVGRRGTTRVTLFFISGQNCQGRSVAKIGISGRGNGYHPSLFGPLFY